jgi:type IV pilus assembly protein PilM
MLGFVQNIFGARVQPIGVDFGSDCLRLAQVQQIGKNFKLVAAASADVPANIRHDPPNRLQFFIQQVPQLLGAAPFRGRQAVLALPAASMHIQHLQLNRMNDEALKKAVFLEALGLEALGKLPIDPSLAVLRHYVVGQINSEQDGKLEVILMAAAREWIQQLLVAAAAARLDIVGMNVEPMALVDCFSHIYRRKSDAHMTQCLVDIGSSGTRATIWRAGQMLFARGIPIGGDRLTQAAATALSIGFEDARTLRIKLAANLPPPTVKPASGENRRVADGSGAQAAPPGAADDAIAESLCATTTALALQAWQVEQACRQTVSELAGQLHLCRRDHEATFPAAPVDRLIFVGGEARQRHVCRQIANHLGLASQLGDPMCRLSDAGEPEIETGIDRRAPQPAWAVAIGLSMGAYRRAAA